MEGELQHMPPTLVKTGLKAESGGLAQLSQEVKVGNHVIYKNGNYHSKLQSITPAVYCVPLNTNHGVS